MKWSKLKKNVESFFTDKEKGKVELRSVSYNGTHDNDGRGYITVDGKEVWDMCTLKYFPKEYEKVSEHLKLGSETTRDAQIIGIEELDREGVYSQWGYYNHSKEFCSLPIESSISSEVPLLKVLALLDSCIGKRTLTKIDVSKDQEMVRCFYNLRCELENVRANT